ncbi:MAG: riboflavin synthase subunit alpha [Candidatus Solincola sediminis]|uniref:Riboflavin synthase n=1 Tax=Candidatus Solincola sediminis TaxID=1797199 RepID=A0A1F2WGR7_9ACTN|nr:MAG: riboflavin synthase subunit alpha [Candidatus Solincola sediminis]OFW58278.1 MAG: riboflavin synthase subunit alpha [Candidatus Solincola sediminis]
MFTGIIEEVGTVRELRVAGEGARITVSSEKVWKDLEIGESVSVNGVCLTAVETGRGYFSADMSSESLGRSTLGGMRRGSPVNLERALSLNSRLGGHIVQGHVDGIGTVRNIEKSGEGALYSFGYPGDLDRYMVDKGSVAVDGISLTIGALRAGEFTAAVIPHTLHETDLKSLKAGDGVNLEVDIIAKYVQRFLDKGSSQADESGDASLYRKLLEGGFA